MTSNGSKTGVTKKPAKEVLKSPATTGYSQVSGNRNMGEKGKGK